MLITSLCFLLSIFCCLLRKLTWLQVMPWNSLKQHKFSETNVISLKVVFFWQRESHFPRIFFFLLKHSSTCALKWFPIFFAETSKFPLKALFCHHLFLSFYSEFLYYSTISHLQLFWRVDPFNFIWFLRSTPFLRSHFGFYCMDH